MEKRSLGISELRAEEESEVLKISGYFILFNEETELYDGIFEKVDPNALDKTLENDIRCLFNHDTGIVLGRSTNNTLSLLKDEKGLYCEVLLNAKDSEAINVYERVKRGDINQCSFGFNIVEEERNFEDDNMFVTIKELDLHEVSIVTFPAYPNTSVSARSKQLEDYKQERFKLRKNKLLERLGV